MVQKALDFSQLDIIIPTLNEEKNIPKLIDVLVSLYPNVSITIVDDGSKDRTQNIVKKLSKFNKNISLLDRSKKPVKGLTASVVDGILKTKKQYFVVMDADFQHPPSKVKEIYEKLTNDNDLVIGKREKVLCDWPLHRKLISKTAIMAGNCRLLLNGKYYCDIVSGFFGAKSSKIQEVVAKNISKFEMQGYKVLFDILKYIPNNIMVDYVPYEFGLRDAGSSKMSSKHIISYARSLLK